VGAAFNRINTPGFRQSGRPVGNGSYIRGVVVAASFAWVWEIMKRVPDFYWRCRMPMPGFLRLSRLAKPLTSEEGHRILERDRYRCQYCGLDGMSGFENSLVMTVDFVIPRGHKGKKYPTNLVAACRPCNLIKGRRVFGSLAEAKMYVLQRRADLHKEWEAKIARLRRQSVTA